MNKFQLISLILCKNNAIKKKIEKIKQLKIIIKDFFIIKAFNSFKSSYKNSIMLLFQETRKKRNYQLFKSCLIV